MSKLSEMAAPKSDQLNASDLVAGPMDITVTRHKVVGGDQPLELHADNIPGRPWKPCKTMMRWMSEAWKTDEPADIVGKSIRLYCDPEVQFGGMKTGGIRISHLSHIDGDLHLQEGNRRQYRSLKVKVVKPLKVEAAPKAKPVERAPDPEDAPTPTFDFPEFEGIVSLAIANMGADFPTWWEEQKPLRLQARDADKKRAGEIATRANEFIESLKEI